MGFARIGRMVTSRIWRRIQTGTAESGDVGSPSNPRSYKWGRRRSRRCDPVFCGETRRPRWSRFRARGFLRKNAARFRCWRLPQIYRWFGSRKVRDEAPSSNVDIKKQFPDRAESSLSRRIPEPAQIIRASTAGTPMIRGKSTETRDPTRISDRPSRSNRVIERGVRGAQ